MSSKRKRWFEEKPTKFDQWGGTSFSKKKVQDLAKVWRKTGNYPGGVRVRQDPGTDQDPTYSLYVRRRDIGALVKQSEAVAKAKTKSKPKSKKKRSGGSGGWW